MPGLLRRLAACRRDLAGLVEGVAGRDRRLQAHPLEATVLESRIRLGRNPVLIAAFMSVVTDEDRWGKRWMTKERSLSKIGSAVALCMALGAAAAGSGPLEIDVMAIIA